MARRQEAPTTTGTTVPTDQGGSGIDSTTAAAIAAALASQRPTSVANPIGVPYYQIDPRTGQPMLDANGQPMRWHPTATTNTVDARGQLVHGVGSTANPRYFDGDQWAPASLPPDELAALQRAMVAAGLLKPGQAQLGVWDPASVNAYSELLGYANSSGLDVNTALQRWGTAHANDPSTDIRQPLTVRVSDPNELEQVFRSVVIDKLGKGYSHDQLQAMVAAYQGVETQAQYQQYAMTGSGSQTDPGTGGTVTAPPSPGAFAEAQVRAQDPTGVAEHDSLGFVNAFNNLVGKWSG